MHQNIDTIIFDMDGVIIESASIWKRAEREVFTSVGVEVTDELSARTATMTTEAVTKFWHAHQPWHHKPLQEVESEVINRVAQLIKAEGKAVQGIEKLVHDLKSNGFKIGLATNSPPVLIPVVLETLKLKSYFDVISSSEEEAATKPDPAVYLTTAKKLGSDPAQCLAVEDSYSGALAAKQAGMSAVLITKKRAANKKKEIADFTIESYDQFKACLYQTFD